MTKVTDIVYECTTSTSLHVVRLTNMSMLSVFDVLALALYLPQLHNNSLRRHHHPIQTTSSGAYFAWPETSPCHFKRQKIRQSCWDSTFTWAYYGTLAKLASQTEPTCCLLGERVLVVDTAPRTLSMRSSITTILRRAVLWCWARAINQEVVALPSREGSTTSTYGSVDIAMYSTGVEENGYSI